MPNPTLSANPTPFVAQRSNAIPKTRPSSRGALPSCSRCAAEWAGALTCHRAGCHRTFGGLTTFDKHRKNGKCVDPVTIGLELKRREYECWGFPTDDTKWWEPA